MAIQSTSRIVTQGTLNNTGNALDLALDGDGFFQVEMPGGQLGYTRAGNFTRSAEGELVTVQGYRVQPGITIPEDAQAISVAPDGTVSATTSRRRRSDGAGPDPGRILHQSGRFAGRRRQLFCSKPARAARHSSALPENAGRGNVRQGMLEASNVNVVEELVDMIECQRAYEINSKMISAVDEMLRNANQTM